MVIKTSSHMISLYFPCKFKHGESWIEKLGLCILINLISILKKTYRILTSLISILYWYRILTKRVQSKANHLFHHLLTQINGTIIEPKIDSFKLSGLISFSNYYFSISWLSNCESLCFLEYLPTLCCKRYFFWSWILSSSFSSFYRQFGSQKRGGLTCHRSYCVQFRAKLIFMNFNWFKIISWEAKTTFYDSMIAH